MPSLADRGLPTSLVPAPILNNGRVQGITSLASGVALLTTTEGSVYSCDVQDLWVENRCSKQGCADIAQPQSSLMKVQFPEDQVLTITDIAAGREHCLALSSDGMVYSWGDNTSGQLGTARSSKKQRKRLMQKGDEATQGNHIYPKIVGRLPPYSVIQVSCGAEHSLALTKAGVLFSWGLNQQGQLGVVETEKKIDKAGSPTRVEALHGIPLAQITAGHSHSVAVSVSGAVFVWGSNEYRQLGLRRKRNVRIPCYQKTMKMEDVEMVSCGESHTSFLKKDGRLLVYGKNMRRQTSEVNHSELQPGQADRSLSFTHVSSTSHFSFLADEVTGCFFVVNHEAIMWCSADGEETFRLEELGQSVLTPARMSIPSSGTGWIELEQEEGSSGKGVEQDRVKGQTLGMRPWTSGVNGHSAALGGSSPASASSTMGSSLSFGGAEEHDQECHLSEIRGHPARVEGSSPAASSSLGCSLSSAGAGENGPDCDQSEAGTSRPLWKGALCAGRDHVFLVGHVQEERKPLDHCPSQRRGVWRLSAELLEKVGELMRRDWIWKKLTRAEQYLVTDLKLIFSSCMCINASFLSTGLRTINGPNIDLQQARQSFKSIMDSVVLLEELSKVIHEQLTASTLRSPSHDEALRFYLTIMECPVFSYPEHEWCRQVLAAIGGQIRSLCESGYIDENKKEEGSVDVSSTLVRWWKFEPTSFQRTVEVFRQAISYLVKEESVVRNQQHFTDYLAVLKALYEVNVMHNIIPIRMFYVKERNLEWMLKRFHSPSHCPRTVIKSRSWLDYSFLLDINTKLQTLTQHDKHRQERTQEATVVVERNISMWNPYYYLPVLPFLPVRPRLELQVPVRLELHLRPRLELHVDRGDVMGDDTLNQLSQFLHYPPAKLCCPLAIRFLGERGVDEGVLSVEFFRLAFKEVLDTNKHNIFRFIDDQDPTQSPVWFNSECRRVKLLQGFGLIFALALFNRAMVPFPVPQLLYSKLLSKSPRDEMDELRELDQSFADQMTALLTGTEDYVRDSCFGEEVMMSDGRSADVTKANVDRFVELKVRAKLAPWQFGEFQKGFNKVYHGESLELLRMFRPVECETVIRGEKYFDWKALQKSTEYDQPYSESHTVIRMFWSVFHALDQDLKRKFLVFVAGSDRVPVGGLGRLGLTIAPLELPFDEEDRLATEEEKYSALSSVCPVGLGCNNGPFNRTLRLPEYRSREKLEERLKRSLDNYDCPFQIA